MVEVIAEIGGCHDGSLDQAIRLIQTAKDCGADVAKVQYWSSAARMAQRRKAPDYEAIYRRYQVPESWLPVLAAEAKRIGLVFACSSYLPEDVDTVAKYAQIMKISSFEARNRELLEAHRPYLSTRSVVVSFGLGASQDDLRDVFSAGDALHVVRLHCVTAYPAPLNSLNLDRIADEGFDGYSDHSGDIRVGGWAVAAGARIIEAHLRLDETDNENPDAGPHALCPVAFDAYVREIRDVAQALHGNPAEAEIPMSRYAVR